MGSGNRFDGILGHAIATPMWAPKIWEGLSHSDRDPTTQPGHSLLEHPTLF